MILIHVNVTGIENIRTNYKTVPHFSLGSPDKIRAEYLFMMLALQKQIKLQSTIYRNECSPDYQPSVLLFEDLTTYTEDWLPHVFV